MATMNRLFAASLFAASMTVPLFSASARADGVPPPRRGFQLGIRTGYRIPLGKTDSLSQMSEWTTGQVPIVADIGSKVSEHWFIGGYAGLGFGRGGTRCSTCVSTGVVGGFEVLYSFLPSGRTNPWIGYGLGVEGLSLSDTNPNVNLTLVGIEFAHLLGGVDFRITRAFGIGPFVDFGAGQYVSASITDSGWYSSGSITNRAFHQWFALGLRITVFP